MSFACKVATWKKRWGRFPWGGPASFSDRIYSTGGSLSRNGCQLQYNLKITSFLLSIFHLQNAILGGLRRVIAAYTKYLEVQGSRRPVTRMLP